MPRRSRCQPDPPRTTHGAGLAGLRPCKANASLPSATTQPSVPHSGLMQVSQQSRAPSLDATGHRAEGQGLDLGDGTPTSPTAGMRKKAVQMHPDRHRPNTSSAPRNLQRRCCLNQVVPSCFISDFSWLSSFFPVLLCNTQRHTDTQIHLCTYRTCACEMRALLHVFCTSAHFFFKSCCFYT